MASRILRINKHGAGRPSKKKRGMPKIAKLKRHQLICHVTHKIWQGICHIEGSLFSPLPRFVPRHSPTTTSNPTLYTPLLHSVLR